MRLFSRPKRFTVPRVGSADTLRLLAADVNDGAMTQRRRARRSKRFLDAFVGHGNEGEVIARSERVFTHALRLPYRERATRLGVMRTLVTDLVSRSCIAAKAARVASETNNAAVVATSWHQSVEPLRHEMTLRQYSALQDRVAQASKALCVNYTLVYRFAKALSPDCLAAFIENGGGEAYTLVNRMAEHMHAVTARFIDGSEIASASKGERPALDRADAFVRAVAGEAMRAQLASQYPHRHRDIYLSLLRFCLDQTPPPQLERLTAFFRTPLGQQFQATTLPVRHSLAASARRELLPLLRRMSTSNAGDADAALPKTGHYSVGGGV